MDRDERYRAPAARVADRGTAELIERPLGLLAIALIVPFALAFAAVIVMNAMPGYSQMFEHFGLRLSWPTHVALRSQPAWWVLAAIGVARAIVIVRTSQAPPARYRSLRRGQLLLIAASVVLAGVVVYGIMVPLTQLASVV